MMVTLLLRAEYIFSKVNFFFKFIPAIFQNNNKIGFEKAKWVVKTVSALDIHIELHIYKKKLFKCTPEDQNKNNKILYLKSMFL